MKTITVREACRYVTFLANNMEGAMQSDEDKLKATPRLLRAQQRRIKELEREVALLANDAGSTRVSNFGRKKGNHEQTMDS
jgi:hypothetical protein